jgi:arabinofuranan 3-O-arabinosyltransferase
VQSGLFAGYLFPTAPYYALVNALGISTWVAQRLWLGLILALAAWGVVRLMDELWGRSGPLGGRGPAHVVAALVYALNPFVVVTLASRGSVPLLAHAALPWAMLAIHRGLEEPRGWRWPAFAGLVLAAAGGAINAAVIVWVALGAAALGLYETAVLGRARRALWSVGWRSVLCVVVASLWWLVPLALQGGLGANFQQFAEQPGTIWATTSLPESLRLLGFWVLYLGTGFGHAELQLSVARDFLFRPGVVAATFALPLGALGGLRWTRGWRYAPFFGLLAVAAVVVMAAGFPPGTPLRRALLFASDHATPLEVVRTTYKAAPLLALSLGCLAGVAAEALLARVRRRWVPAVALAGVGALACLPLIAGRAIDQKAAYGKIPAAWPRAMHAASDAAPPGRRVLLLPGSLFADYRWGSTTESVGPPLSSQPLLVRQAIRYADPRAAQLQDATDDLVQQERLVPGQLAPLLGLMGVGEVAVQTDDRPDQSGSLPPAGLRDALAGQPGFARPSARLGRERAFPPLWGRSGGGAILPELSLFPVRPAGAPLVRLEPLGGGAVVDGDAEGIVELASHGALAPGLPLTFAGDLDRRQLAERVRQGSTLVLTDSARRRIVSASRLRANHGPTLGPSDPISPDSPQFELFPGLGSDDRTVALYSGLRYLRSPRAPDLPQLPEHRAYAALDGRLDTQWTGSAHNGPDQYLELALVHPRRVGAIRVWPLTDNKGRTSRLAVSVNGGDEADHAVHPGWNRISLGGRVVRTLRIRVSKVTARVRGAIKGAGGIAELRVPGLHVRERLRLPERMAREAQGMDLSRTPLEVLLERTTADFPYRAGAGVATPEAGRELDMVDAEPGIERELSLPALRSFGVTGWASARPGRRASSAFDGSTRTWWAGELLPGRNPWLSVRSPRPLRITRLRLAPGPPDYRFPARVRISGQVAAVSPTGQVELARPLRTRTLRLEVLATRDPGRTARLRAAAISEVSIPGLAAPRPRRAGAFASPCGGLSVRAGPSRAALRVSGRLEDLDAGRPLRLGGCGPLPLQAGASGLSAPPGAAFRPDHLRLLSPAPVPAPAPRPAGVVIDPGHGSGGERRGVALQVRGPAQLVLAESYSSGWRAFCTDGSGHERDLGAPRPAAAFANGWRVGPDCVKARFAFAPNTTARVSYLASVLGIAALLAVVGVAWLRRRRHPARPAPSATAEPGPPDSLALAAAVGLVGGFVFALRAGGGLALATVVLARVGVGARRLFALAGALLAAIPVIYLAFTSSDAPRHAFDYAIDHIGAHWVAVAAVCCLAAGCALDAARLRRRLRRG